MMLSRKWILLTTFFAFICLEPLRHVQAYIDPGTGSYVLQIVMVALFGALFALKVFWAKIKVALVRVQTLLFKRNHNSAEQ